MNKRFYRKVVFRKGQYIIVQRILRKYIKNFIFTKYSMVFELIHKEFIQFVCSSICINLNRKDLTYSSVQNKSIHFGLIVFHYSYVTEKKKINFSGNHIKKIYLFDFTE